MYISTYIALHVLGRGVPSLLKARTNALNPLSSEEIPTGNDAKTIYERKFRGRITEQPSFGVDPLANHPEIKQQVEDEWEEKFDVSSMFQEICNRSWLTFQEAILFYINLTTRLSQSIDE